MRPLALLAIAVALLAAAQAVAVLALAPRRTIPVSHQEVHQALQPGELAGTLMLGGMRGLACDLLWLRADAAKQAGRLYEGVALAETISRIQPRFDQVWQYLAWDMAYNLSHEVEDRPSKWAWFVAGLKANIRGCERNPHSERLLRHLAWMFHHKGDNFHEEVERTDWRPLLGPVFAAIGEDPGDGIAPGASNFRISARIYQACVRLAERRAAALPGSVKPPSFIRRMIPLAIENAGNLQRNQGAHSAALATWLEALRAWRSVHAWSQETPADEADARGRATTVDSWERNEGRLRRKAATLGRALAPDAQTGERFAAAVEERRLEDAQAMLALGGWRPVAANGGIRWLDER